MEGTTSDEEFIKFLDILLCRFVTLSILVPIVHETTLNDGGTYFVSSCSFILSHVSIGGRPRAARLFPRFIQYWLVWPDSFITTYLTFLDSINSYHMKYLFSWSVKSMKNCGSWRPSKLWTSILMLFRYWASGLDVLSVLLRRLFFRSLITCGLHFGQPFVECLKSI